MTRRPNLGGRRIICGDGLTRTLYDANYTLAVTIAPADNDNPICGNPNECVIAHAVQRVEAAKGRAVTVSIGADKAYIQRDDTVLRFQVPSNEAALIRTFDALGAFPVGFTVHLVPVRPSDRLGARPKERGRKDRTKTLAPASRERRLPTRHIRAPQQVVARKEQP